MKKKFGVTLVSFATLYLVSSHILQTKRLQASSNTAFNKSKLDQQWNVHVKDLRRVRVLRSLSDRVVITQHFTERTVTPGEDISMQCSATGDRPPQFTWERDGIIISSNTDPRYTLGQIMTSDNTVLSQINITRVRVEDGGLYVCSAREGVYSARHENRMDVYGPPYIRSLPPIKVQSGESVNLRCPYYGYPVSKIDWEYEGKILTSNMFTRYKRASHHKRKIRRNVSSINVNGVLSIPEVTKDQNGAVYTCMVTSPSGEMARRAFEIQVVEAPILEELMLGNNLQEGQIVNIYCNVRSGDLPLHFEWLKDGKRIPSHLKVIERNSDLFSALIIKKVALEHCGVYTCVASNHIAKVNRSTELYIKVAPKWTEEPTNSSLLLGRKGIVPCSASGYPQPQVHWMKKDAILGTWQPVLELTGGGMLSLSNGTLILEAVSLSDEGLYSCNVENGVGQPLSKTIWMSVNKPVYFETLAVNVTSQLGQIATLECRPIGDDPIRVIWTHQGNLLSFENQRFKLSESKTSSGLLSRVSLQFTEIQDAGVYQCRANNPYGSATFHIVLTVLEPPIPPTEVHVTPVTSSTWRISWRAFGGSSYIVQYAPANREQTELANTLNVTSQDTELRQSTDLQNLRAATSYTVRVATVNQVGVSHFSSAVYFTTQEEAPSAPPINVQVEQTRNPGELYLSWLPPLKETHNGVIVGYHVKAVPQNMINNFTRQHKGKERETDTRRIKISHPAGKQETVFSGLLKNTRYAVSIAAFTSAGTGPYSLPVYRDTREGAPEQSPSSVECTAVSSTSLRVGWQSTDHEPGSSLVGHTLLFAPEDGVWHNTTSLQTEVYLHGLMKFTNYTVKVAGYSNYGVGPYSYPIVCSTLQDVPGPPAGIKVLVLSSSSLLASWKKPEQPNGEILYYTVYIKPTTSTTTPQTQRVTSGFTSELKQLTSGRTYEVWVTAATVVGEGPATLRSTHTPTHRVVAGVWSIGGIVSAGAGSSLLLPCACVGIPPPRTVWYHKHHIITHHPRFTRNHDDSLLINNIDQSLSGNYTCLAKNLYGSDSVEYNVIVMPLPDAPILKATPYKDSLLIEWEQPYSPVSKNVGQKINYGLTWKESNGPWQEAWPTSKLATLSGVQKHVLSGLKCGTKYSLRITATNKVGTSQPAYLDVSTLGGLPIPPVSTSWLWSNSTDIGAHTAGWQDGGCDVITWQLQYRLLNGGYWRHIQANHHAITYQDILSIGNLAPGTWYQIKVTAINEAGTVTRVYNYATKNEDGTEVGPPTEFLDFNVLVIACSSVLLAGCLASCVYILLQRKRAGNLTGYRNSIPTDKSSESRVIDASLENKENRIYSEPLHHCRNPSKHELYEISPYAQFAVGFRTFGQVENQDAPSRQTKHSRYDTETSFQVYSESEDSDSISKATLKSVPRNVCRTPHHR